MFIIIRKDSPAILKLLLNLRWKVKIEIRLRIPDLHAFTEGFDIPADRTKPLGCTKRITLFQKMRCWTFAVINADALRKGCFWKALNSDYRLQWESVFYYRLVNCWKTLFDNGTVNRGVCQGWWWSNLYCHCRVAEYATKDGKIISDDDQQPKELPPLDSSVSMNSWCFDPAVFTYTENHHRSLIQCTGT